MRPERPVASRGFQIALLSTVALAACLTLATQTQVTLPSVPEVDASGSGRARPAAGASIVVTLRWGHTEAATERDPDGLRTDSVNWDGYLALDCGAIEKVESLAFEDRLPDAALHLSAADFVGPVVAGESGEQRVYWRSQTRAAWDGLRVRLRACDPSTASPKWRAASTLFVRTAQRSYTARLDWSANDFVALQAEEPGQKLEVYITAEYDDASVRGARITELTAH